MPTFVGRTESLARLTAAYRAVTGTDGRAPAWAGLALVTGEAGIGKTALLTRFAAAAEAEGGTVAWGTGWDDGTAPAWWPWTQALRALLERRPGLAPDVPPALAAI
ncbi:MAG: ATP-binding protein, partial [Micromonosporaceae bacterium]|nr:ATP-binding protein [Micromonosporaceae bacterium]